MAPKIKTSTAQPLAGFVTVTLSPGKYPIVLAKRPLGISPSSQTTALPSREGRAAAKRTATVKTVKTNETNLFIKSPQLIPKTGTYF